MVGTTTEATATRVFGTTGSFTGALFAAGFVVGRSADLEGCAKSNQAKTPCAIGLAKMTPTATTAANMATKQTRRNKGDGVLFSSCTERSGKRAWGETGVA